MSYEDIQPINTKQDLDRAVAFISYARKDQAFVRRLAETLRLKSIDVRGDWQLERGEGYAEQLRLLIRGSDAFIFVISPESSVSGPCKKEIDIAVEMKKRVFPILHRNYSDDNLLPPEVREPQWAFLRDEDDFVAEIQKLVEAINTDFELLPLHRDLLADAEAWQRSNRNPSYLLRKHGLKEAEEWLSKTSLHPTMLPKPTSLQSEYLLASKQARSRGFQIAFGIVISIVLVLSGLTVFAFVQRDSAKANERRALDNEAEAQRQKKQAEDNAEEARKQKKQAEDNADEARKQKKQAEDNADEANWQATIAKQQRDIAEEKRRLALTRQLAAQSQLLIEQPKRLQLATLLAVESIKHLPSIEADQSLRSALGRMLSPLVSIDHKAKFGVNHVQISHDGQYLASSSTADNPSDATILVSDIKSGRELNRLILNHKTQGGYTQTPFKIKFSHSDEYLAIATSGEIWLWKWKTKEPPRAVDARYHVSFSVDDEYVAGVSNYVNNEAQYHVVNVFQTATGKRVGRLVQSGWVNDLEFSPTTPTLVVGAEDGKINIWSIDEHNSRIITDLKLSGKTTDVDFSRDGLLLAGASEGGEIAVWDTSDYSRTLSAKLDAEVTSLAFSGDGRLLATQSRDGTTRTWDARSGREIARQPLRENPIGVVFCGRDHYVAMGSYADDVRLWNARTGETFAQAGQDTEVNDIAASSNGNFLATAGADGLARVWEINTAEPARRLLHGGEVDKVLLSQDSTALAVSSDDGAARMWDVAEGEEIPNTIHRGRIENMALSRDRNRFAVAKFGRIKDIGESLVVDIQAVGEGKRIARLFHPYRYRQSYEFNNDDLEKTALLIECRTDGTKQNLFESSQVNEVVPIIYLDDTKKGLYRGNQRPSSISRSITTVGEMNVNSPEADAKWSGSGSSMIGPMSFSHDGSILATSIFDQVWLWNTATGNRIARLSHGYEAVPDRSGFENGLITLELASMRQLFFSSDGHYLITITDSGVLRIWDIGAGKFAQPIVIDKHMGRRLLALNSEVNLFAATNDARPSEFSVLSLPALKPMKSLRPKGAIDQVSFSASGRYAVSVSHSKGKNLLVDGEGFVGSLYYVQIWDMAKGKVISSVTQDTAIHAVSFSNDENFIVTGDQAGAVRVWKIQTGQEVSRIMHKGAVRICMFAENDQFIVTSTGATGRVKTNEHPSEIIVSRWRSEDLMNEACTRLTRNLTRDEWQRYLGNEPYGVTCSHISTRNNKENK